MAKRPVVIKNKTQLENTNQNHEVNKEELIDELKKLDVGNQEEAAYIDMFNKF